MMYIKTLENILSIFFTFEVSKFDKFIDFKLLQLENIEVIMITFDLGKFDKSNEENLIQRKKFRIR